MDAKTIFQPKIWYIICGAMALIGGIENNINAESWADSAWGADGVNDQSIAMEKLRCRNVSCADVSVGQ